MRRLADFTEIISRRFRVGYQCLQRSRRPYPIVHLRCLCDVSLLRYVEDGSELPGTALKLGISYCQTTPRLRATVVGLRMLSPMTTSVRLWLVAEVGVVITSISVLLSFS